MKKQVVLYKAGPLYMQWNKMNNKLKNTSVVRAMKYVVQ